MARRSPVTLGLALIFLFINNYGLATETCRSGCKGAAQTFKYHEGTTYKYNFDSKIQVSLSSAEGQQSVTEVKATVLLTQQAECNQVIRLQNVQVVSNDGKKHSHIPDVDKPIKINYHDGHLEDSICVEPGDSQNSINLKRAIASIFQANLKSGHETDVFGLCPTEVSQHKEGSFVVVQKTRNLNRCAFRETIKQEFLTTVFNLNSEIKSSPILNGDYEAKLKIKNGILDLATIHEKYLYVPFSVGNNGAKTSVDTTLKYVGTAKDSAAVKCSQPRSIIFEDPHPVHSPQTNVNGILGAVKQVAKTIDITVGENTAKEFINLIKILRVSKKDDLLAVYNQVRAGVGFTDKVAAKKIFLDALLRAGNGDNVEVAIELLKNNEFSDIEKKLVFLGLSTVRHATENSLTAAINLLNLKDIPREAYLGVGNLAGRFCRQHNCDKVAAVDKLIQKLLQQLGSGKPNNKHEEHNVIYVLKALRNIHHLNDNIVSKLVTIAQDKKASNHLRVAALEVFLADSCKDKLRDSALNILKDIQEDSEVRIKAYLAVAQCPNSKVASSIKTILENEPSYQVGGFISTHIRNLRASTNPDKELAKQHLGQIRCSKKFPLDLRKYSANGEFSYTIDSLGMANSIESNIIYSRDSFLPRSTSLNLTAEIFGHNFNFLEIETRQENLDRLVEHYLGPQGLLRSKTLQELWDDKGKHAHKVYTDLKDRLQKSLRARRDVSKSDIDYITKQITKKTSNLDQDVDVDFSVKSFGSELLYFNIHRDINKLTPEQIIDKVVNEMNGCLDKLKNFEETLRSNILFLDAEFAYPTSSGFPLRLGVEGSSNIQVKAAGAIDIRALLSEDSTLKLSLIPSANIEVAGRLTIDTQVVESGLKVISTLHTATGGDLIVQLHKDSLDVKFSLPVEKQNLVAATHDIVFHTREWGAPEANAPLKFAQNKDFSICLDQLSPFIGLTFCGEFTGPNLQGQKVPILPFPLSGDAKVGVTIEREDIKEYHYQDKFYNSAQKLGVEFQLEALSKNGQKKVNLEIQALLIPEKILKASLTSPITNLLLEGKVTDTANEKSVSLRFVQDQNEYSGKVGVGIHGTPDKSIYKPLIQYKTPQNKDYQSAPYRVDGQVIAERKSDGQTYTLDNVKLVIPNTKEITFNGKLGNEPETVFAEIDVSDGNIKTSVKGKLRVNPNLVKYNAEIKNSVNPQANIRIKGELTKSTDEVKHFFQLAQGGDFSDKNNIITMENSWKYRNKGPHDFLLGTNNKLTYPAFGTNVKFDFELKPNAVEYEANVQYSNVKLGSELEWEHNTKKEGTDFKLEFGLWGMNNNLNLKSQRKVTGEQSQIENSLEINGKRGELNGKIKHHVRPQDVDVAADLILKVPTHNTPFNVVSGLRVNSNEFDASHKVTSGGTVYIDVFLKANRGGNANGSIKVNLKDQLTINGQVKANKGTGSGEVVIELPKVGRTTKIDSTFTIHEPTYNLVINIYPLFNKDKSKKITLSTHTTAKPEDLNTKNFIDVFGEKLEVNAKCSQHGEITNGKTNGEIDITLPNHHFFSAKLNRDLKNVDNVLNGNVQASAEYRTNKNQPGNKIAFKGQMRNTKPNDNIYDVEYQMTGECTEGHTLNVDLAAKRSVQGGTANLEITNKVSGNVLSSPIENSIKSTCKNFVVTTYDLSSSFAPLGKVVVSGKHDISGDGKPITGNIKLDVETKSKSLKTLKAELGGSIEKKDGVVGNGKLKLYADSSEGPLVDFQSEGEVKSNDKESRVKGVIKSGKLNPITFDAGLGRSESKNTKEVNGDVAVKYANNQNIKSSIHLIKLHPHEYKLDAKLDLPLEKFKSSRLQVHSKHNEDRTHFQSESTLTIDGKNWVNKNEIFLSEHTPSVDFKLTCPEGKLRHFLLKITKISEKQLAGQLKIVDQKNNFLLEGTVDANAENIDDFNVKITANSPNLKIDKYLIEAHNKPAKTGRRIQINAKSGNKNILAGSTGYTSREEQGKMIVEGSGSFKLHDQTKSANFKYIRQNLMEEKNGETGMEISFDGSLGSKAIDAELKITNKQFHILNSFCEEKQECVHFEVDVKTTADDLRNFNQIVEIAVDLRKLGLPHEFGLKAVTTRKEYVIDHTVDVHIQSQDKSKYQYSVYLHPKEAGVSLTTPKRKIALEANVNIPNDFVKNGGKISSELVLYADKKNQPNKKSGLITFLDIKQGKTLFIAGEARFTHPTLSRPLIVNGQFKLGENNLVVEVTADVFAQPDQKIIGSYTEHWADLDNLKKEDSTTTVVLKSTGLGIDVHYEDWVKYSIDDKTANIGAKVVYKGPKSKYNSGASFTCSSNGQTFDLEILNNKILKVNSNLKKTPKGFIVDTEVHRYGSKPCVSHFEAENWTTLKYSLALKDKPQDKLQINSEIVPGQIAKFKAEFVKNGAPQELAHATVKLDNANFFKCDYDVNSKNVDEFVKELKKLIEQNKKELQGLSDKLSNSVINEAKEVGELAKGAAPNLKPLRDYYGSEVNKIKNEILEDKSIKNASEFLYNILSVITQAVSESFGHFSELVENIVNSFQSSFKKIIETVQKDILPKVKELCDKLTKSFTELIDSLTNIVLTIGAKIAEIAEKYKPELQQLATVFGEVSQDVFIAITNLFEAVKGVIVDQCEQISNELKQFPVFEQLKSEYERFVSQGLPPPEAIANGIKDVLYTLKDIVPTPEMKEFIEALADYITKKIMSQPVDDKQAIDRIANAGVASVKQVVNSVYGAGASDLDVKVPVPTSFWNKLPGVAPMKFSPFSYVLSEDLDVPSDFLLSLVNKPRNWFPPFPLEGLLAQGQHIFTFDGKHLTFPGSCNYLLVRDSVDGNFTLIGSYKNGFLESISLTHGTETMTLKKTGQLLVNNAPSEFPARKPHIAAFRGVFVLNLVSDFGIMVTCAQDLSICSVKTSGFYHGKLRGLLGNGNNEPFDDFTTANGEIVTSESDFGNSYKTSAGCAAVQTVSHHDHHSTPVCEKLFGWESSMRLCYPFVNNNNFKMACEHGIQAGNKDTELAVTRAYVEACRQHNIPVHVPEELVKCVNGEKSTNVGDKFSVKIPGKSADIVLLVDTSKENEGTYKEYVQPLIQQITSDLSSKGVKDIEFHLIAFGGENQWPTYITSGGGKVAFKNKGPNLKFTENPKKDTLVTDCPHLDALVETIQGVCEDLKLAFGLDVQAWTYNEALKYPFRAHAIKSIIAVTAKPCKVGRLYPLQLLRTLLYRSRDINLNLITPISRDGAKAEAKNIVGFNSDDVFALGQTKNKIKHFSDLDKELTYNDYCIDFTVNNGGNVFVSDHINLQPKGTRKQFIQVTSHGIVDKLVGSDKTYDCECELGTPFSAVNVCRLASSIEKPQAKKAGTKS